MTVTVLAVLFLAAIAIVAAAGRRLMTRGESAGDAPEEVRCWLCKTTYDRALTVERQIGDHRIVYFCRSCIMKLHADLGTLN